MLPAPENGKPDVDAVITSFNQGSMILEAVESLCTQTQLPRQIVIVDDGSTEETSLQMLLDIQRSSRFPIPVSIHYQENGGVSSARNTGIHNTQAPFVLILDGDDRLAPEFIDQVSQLLRENPSMVAASSYMQTFGVLDSLVCPTGGGIAAFLSRNCCPATHILRRAAYASCGGYDETMRSGFEDWDFFLSLLETAPRAHIGIVKQPLIHYRTAPASFNVRSMEKRLARMEGIIKKHIASYHDHILDALLGLEAAASARLYAWETEVTYALDRQRDISGDSRAFLTSPSYGDGGMACAVRILSHTGGVLPPQGK